MNPRMIATCPKCSTRHRVDGALLGGQGLRLRCTRCQVVFRVLRPETRLPPADSGIGGRIGSFAAAGLLGALLGGAAVWLALGERRPAAAEPTALAARQVSPGAHAAPPPPLASAVAEPPTTDVARTEPPPVAARPEVRGRPIPPPRTVDTRGRAVPGGDARGGEPEPMLPGAREFYPERARAAALSFVDVADDFFNSLGTADEENAQRELSKRFRNATDFAPEELKDPLRRLYEATRTYGEGGDDVANEWEEARQDLLDAIDGVR